jgi:hypothetical protein
MRLGFKSFYVGKLNKSLGNIVKKGLSYEFWKMNQDLKGIVIEKKKLKRC